jgi:hypothetical protein
MRRTRRSRGPFSHGGSSAFRAVRRAPQAEPLDLQPIRAEPSRLALDTIYMVGDRAVRVRCEDAAPGAVIDAACAPYRTESNGYTFPCVDLIKRDDRFAVYADDVVLACPPSTDRQPGAGAPPLADGTTRERTPWPAMAWHTARRRKEAGACCSRAQARHLARLAGATCAEHQARQLGGASPSLSDPARSAGPSPPRPRVALPAPRARAGRRSTRACRCTARCSRATRSESQSSCGGSRLLSR